MAIPIEPARWRRSQSTEARQSVRLSFRPRYRLAENIGFASVIPARAGVRFNSCFRISAEHRDV
jgi:hypothetical protein